MTKKKKNVSPVKNPKRKSKGLVFHVTRIMLFMALMMMLFSTIVVYM